MGPGGGKGWAWASIPPVLLILVTRASILLASATNHGVWPIPIRCTCAECMQWIVGQLDFIGINTESAQNDF